MEEDDVELPQAVGKDTVRYGEIKAQSGQAMLAAGVAAGNIYRQAADAEVMELPEVTEGYGGRSICGVDGRRGRAASLS